jgi:hypothetical protein
MELARKLAKEMEEHKTVSVSRTYVPNEYEIWLSPEDRARYDGVEHEVIDELAAYLLEHARREKLALPSRPQIVFKTDEALKLGEFGIAARTVKVEENRLQQAEHGRTMVYSVSDRHQEALSEVREPRRRAVVAAEGKRFVVPAAGALIGRSRECDIVLAHPDVSRRHA